MSTKDKLIASAQKNLEKGQIIKAIQDYVQLVALEPKVVGHRQKLAEIQSRAGLKDEAIGNYDFVAKSYTEAGFYPKASAVYKQIQKLDPERVDAYLRLAELSEKLGMAGNAVAELRNLAALLEKKGKATEAVEIYRKMAEVEPDNLAHKVKIAECYARGGLREKGRDELETLAAELNAKGDFVRLHKLCEVGLQLFSGSLALQIGFARALVHKGESAKGLQLLKGLLKQAPDDVGIQDALAVGYRAIGDFENERLTLQHMLKKQPEELALRERLIAACLAAGEFPRGLSELKEWGARLTQGGHRAAVEGFCATLAGKLPGNAELQGLQQSLGGSAPAVAKAIPAAGGAAVLEGLPAFDALTEADGAPSPVASPAVARPAAPESAAVQALAPAVGGGEAEAPLDFLEGFGSLAFAAPPAAAPPSVEPTPQAEDVADAALEMEMELDLSHFAPDEVFTAAGEGASSCPGGELLLEAEGLDLSMLETESAGDFSAPEEPLAFDLGGSDGVLADVDAELEPLEELEEIEELEELEAEDEPGLMVEGEEASVFELGGTALFDLESASGAALEDGAGGVHGFETNSPLDLDLESDSAGNLAFVSGEVELTLPAGDLTLPEETLELSAPLDFDLGGGAENFVLEATASDVVPECEPAAPADEEEVIYFPTATDQRLAGGATDEVPELDLSAFSAESPAEEDAAPVLENFVDFVAESLAPATAPPVTATVDVHAELEEVGFYLNQGLFADAERICQRILEIDPASIAAREKLTEIASRRQETTEVDISGGDFFDLASEILDDGAFKATEDLPGLEDLDRFRFDGVLSEFKKGIEAQIDVDDTESHYNLGIAYKEMGLVDDALAEFDKAMKDPRRRIDCLTLQGICLAEKGAFDKAEAVFVNGIGNPALSEAERISLNYELGLLYEGWGRPVDALARFEAVAASDTVFRDVAEKTKVLRSQLGEGVGGPPTEAKPSKNRVSYV